MLLHPKKGGTLPKEGDEELKRTNEIKMAMPLLDVIEIQGKTITADALLTERELATYLVQKRKAHYQFTVKGNQPTLLSGTELYFRNRREPDFIDNGSPDHGRLETRKITVSSKKGKGPRNTPFFEDVEAGH